MDKFKSVEIGDKVWADRILNEYSCPSLEYNFTTLFIWSDIYATKIREHEGCLLVRFGKKENKIFLFPAGNKNIDSALEWIFENSKGIPVRFGGLVEEQVQFLEKKYPGKFEFTEDRNMSDYIYTTQSLITLTGKKLSSKRNHINRFLENNPDWSYEAITEENISLVDKMHDEWCEMMESDKKAGLDDERLAVKKALKYFNELELSGGILKSKNKIVAFSIGDRLNDKTFIVHIEKAFHDIQGAYPMINKQYVIHNCEAYEFVNREEDAGDEGLRKAKLSYNPHTILKKFNAVEK